MSRRSLALLALVLLVALAALFLRTRAQRGIEENGLRADSAAGSEPVNPLAAERANARESGANRSPAARETRFEPLPEEPSELVVHVVDAKSGAPVPEAEVFALEVEDYGWWQPGDSAAKPARDIEHELETRGRRLVPDARGDLHLPIPDHWLELMARKDERFGACCVSFGSLPEVTLRLVRCSDCVVHVHDPAGRPIAGASVAMGSDHGAFWRASSDADGSLRVPNLGWLLEDQVRELEAWSVVLDEAAVDPPTRWFLIDEAPPTAIELGAGESQTLRVRVVASDGTPVPIDGSIRSEALWSGGSQSNLRLARPASPTVPLLQGRAALPRAQPGVELLVDILLAGGEEFAETLRMPAPGVASAEVVLRMPEALHVLLARLVDPSGAPLASRELEWIAFRQRAGSEVEEDWLLDRGRTNAAGELALVLADKEPDTDKDGTRRGFLRTRDAGSRLASAPIPLSISPSGAVRDLGTLALAQDAALVSGRVLDDRGLPVAHVRIGVVQLLRVDGEEDTDSVAGVDSYSAAESDAQGAFVVHGTCPGGPMRLNLSRDNHLEPHDASSRSFECGRTTQLEPTLLRAGAIQTSLHLPFALESPLRWTLDGAGMHFERDQPGWETAGKVECELPYLYPGSYRVRLCAQAAPDAPLVSVEGVIVKPGERTLDPRLLDIDLVGKALGERALDVPAKPRTPLVLRILDSSGQPIPQGLWSSDYGDSSDSTLWHSGRIVMPNGPTRVRLTLWSPGFRAWCEACPQESRDVRLEPDWRVEVELEVPPQWRKSELSLRVEPGISMANWKHAAIERCLVPAELDASGRASFECPGECDLEFTLRAVRLEQGNGAARETAEPFELGKSTIRSVPGIGPVRLQVAPEHWKQMAQALGLAR